MIYQKKQNNIGGDWLKTSDLTTGMLLTLASEAKTVISVFEGREIQQDVAKCKIKGFEGFKNVKLNKTTLNGLIDAFGEDSAKWVGKVLTVSVEKSIIAGRRVTILYLLPEGFELKEDGEGYVHIEKSQAKNEKNSVVLNVSDKELKSGDLPF